MSHLYPIFNVCTKCLKLRVIADVITVAGSDFKLTISLRGQLVVYWFSRTIVHTSMLRDALPLGGV